MNSLIVFTSRYRNNTAKIARCFAEKLGSSIIELKDSQDRDPIDTTQYDLIGFGSGVYFEDLASELFTMAEKLLLTNKKTFVFSTSGIGLTYYNNGLIRLLQSKEAVNLGSFACKGEFNAKDFTDNKIFNLLGQLSQGHPGTKDLRAAERFIQKLSDPLK